ncbi:universal stress protein [uncultured Jatrophihabitans sp.]|uniref:universal stress protein n=1 Tax=uncultured Jatrophihabitans sp. TaxID=1610747 RepID=UPI0035CC0177
MGGSAVSLVRVDRVVVGVTGSLGNLAALHAAVAEAQRCHAPLVMVNAWTPPGGETGYRRAPWRPILDLCREQAATTLSTAMFDAFGGPPPGLSVSTVLIRGQAGQALVHLSGHPGDLLVVGAGRRGRLARYRHGAVARYCLSHALGPVLAVPPPELLRALSSGPRRQLSRAGIAQFRS